MEVKLITNKEELIGLEEAWDELVSRCKSRNIFMTYGWNLNWAKHILEHKLLCILIFDDKRLECIAPFFIDDKKIIRLLGQPYSDYADIIMPEPSLKIFEILFAELKKFDWQEIRLEQVDASSTALAGLKNYLAETGMDFIDGGTVSCPILTFGDFPEEELKIRLNKKLVRRQKNHLAKAGKLDYKAYNSEKEILAKIERLFCDLRFREFYKSLIRDFASANQVMLSSLELDGEPISLIFSFIYANKVHSYTNNYDPSFNEYSPGLISFKMDLDEIYGRKLLEYNFGRGEEEYKLRFANKLSKTEKVMIYRNKADFLIGKAAHMAKEAVKRAIK
jgi:hypothetical protein